MAPFRNRDRSNRSGRNQVEHNVLEGLPINQYREMEIAIGQNSTESKQMDKNAWPEPPMPRDSHMLPEHSQQILRAARSGRIYKPPPPPEEDKETMDEEEEQKEVRQGFTVKKWVRVPRHLEEPEPEYLAKRRKGLPSQYAANVQTVTQAAPMRETMVKKTDAEGNVSVYKVLVPEGQAVEGEVQPTEAVSEAVPTTAAPGTVVEGVGVVNAEGVVVANDIVQQTPPRRRPAPPRKKKKSGPGRGKKKVLFVEGAIEQETPASGTSGDLLTVPRVKEEGSMEPSEGGDTPMPDAGDEEEGSGEEGSDDDDREETRSPTSAHGRPASATPIETPSAPAVEATSKVDGDATSLAESAPAGTQPSKASPAAAVDIESSEQPEIVQEEETKPNSDVLNSSELPLSTTTHSQHNSPGQMPEIPPSEPSAPEPEPTEELGPTAVIQEVSASITTQSLPAEEVPASDGEPDLFGSLERQLEQDSESMRIG